MRLPTAALLLCAGVMVTGVARRAWAGPVTATLSITYFEIADNSGDPDLAHNTPNVAADSELGPDGLPVVTSPYGISDVDPTTQEITWWSPALNSNVVETGTGTITLPYDSNMYAPDSTGSNDGTYYETAIISGTFYLATASTISFSLGSDDDSFLYIDGTLIGDNPGIHGVSTVDFTSPTLSAGQHTVEVFYADREQSGASLSLSLDSSGVTIAPDSLPEPPALVLLLTGLAAVMVVRRHV